MPFCRTPALQIPHPQMLVHDFVLVPAAAIAADWLHPETGLSLRAELAARGFKL